MSNTQDSVWPYFQTCSSKFDKNTPLLVLFQISTRRMEMCSHMVSRVWYNSSSKISTKEPHWGPIIKVASLLEMRRPPPPLSATGAFAVLLSSRPCTYLPMTLRSLSRILLKWGRLSGSSSQHCVIRDWSSDLQVFSLTTGRNGGSSCAITRAMISAQKIPDVF